jgi:alkylation response protein AidB-like acyl-CoA dehydrogenase
MDFDLPEELQILRDTVRRFVNKELIPLEREYRHDEEGPMPERLLKPLQEKTKSMGLWMLDVPAEYGGAGLGLLPRCIIIRGHGARPLGIAQRALDMMIGYSQHRVTFGRPLADRQAVQFMIADSAMELHAARLMVYECAWRHDRGDDVRNLSYMVKVMSTEMAGRVVDRAIQVHGGVGLTKDLPLEWWYRQIRSTRITEGANEVLRWRLAQNLIRAQ